MNKGNNNNLPAGDNCMPKMHLRQLAAHGKRGFTYSARGHFT